MNSSELVACATGLANVGLQERARKLVSSIDLIANELAWQGGLELLISCGQSERAVEICRYYCDRIEVSDLDKMEALGKLGDAMSKELARDMIVKLVSDNDCEVGAATRGAELLHMLGFEANARSILFEIATKSMPHASDVLWVADALLFCDLPFTAESVVASIDPEQLGCEERSRHMGLQFQAGLAQLGNERSN